MKFREVTSGSEYTSKQFNDWVATPGDWVATPGDYPNSPPRWEIRKRILMLRRTRRGLREEILFRDERGTVKNNGEFFTALIQKQDVFPNFWGNTLDEFMAESQKRKLHSFFECDDSKYDVYGDGTTYDHNTSIISYDGKRPYRKSDIPARYPEWIFKGFELTELSPEEKDVAYRNAINWFVCRSQKMCNDVENENLMFQIKDFGAEGALCTYTNESPGITLSEDDIFRQLAIESDKQKNAEFSRVQ